MSRTALFLSPAAHCKRRALSLSLAHRNKSERASRENRVSLLRRAEQHGAAACAAWGCRGYLSEELLPQPYFSIKLQSPSARESSATCAAAAVAPRSVAVLAHTAITRAAVSKRKAAAANRMRCRETVLFETVKRVRTQQHGIRIYLKAAADGREPPISRKMHTFVPVRDCEFDAQFPAHRDTWLVKVLPVASRLQSLFHSPCHGAVSRHPLASKHEASSCCKRSVSEDLLFAELVGSLPLPRFGSIKTTPAACSSMASWHTFRVKAQPAQLL